MLISIAHNYKLLSYPWHGRKKAYTLPKTGGEWGEVFVLVCVLFVFCFPKGKNYI